jgi:hypothetical protein
MTYFFSGEFLSGDDCAAVASESSKASTVNVPSTAIGLLLSLP